MRQLIGAAVLGSALFIAGLTGASAAPNQNRDGMVNLAIGTTTIMQDARVAAAAQVASNICGLNMGAVIQLAHSVDLSGNNQTVCNSVNGPVVINQN